MRWSSPLDNLKSRKKEPNERSSLGNLGHKTHIFFNKKVIVLFIPGAEHNSYKKKIENKLLPTPHDSWIRHCMQTMSRLCRRCLGLA